MLQRLGEVADVTDYILVAVDRVGHYGLGAMSAAYLSLSDWASLLSTRTPREETSIGAKHVRKHKTYDEAKCEPRMALDDMAADVAAVVAPAYDALVALDLLAERVLAAREDDTHSLLVASRVGILTGSVCVLFLRTLCAWEVACYVSRKKCRERVCATA